MGIITQELKKLNTFLGKRMYLVIITGIISGILFPDIFLRGKPAVPWVFGVMTFSLSLNTSFADLKRVVSSPLYILLLLFCLHGISPLFAYYLGKFTYGPESLTTVGLVLAAAIPVGVTSVIWSGIASGHLPLALTTVTLDSLASPVTVPLIISLFVGGNISFNATDMLTGLLQMIVFPTLLGILVHDGTKGEIARKDRWYMSFFTKLGISFVVAVNVGAARGYIIDYANKLPPLLLTVIILIFFNFLLGYGFSKLLRFPGHITRTYTFSVGIRNISAGIVIALNYFPSETALPIVLALLFQQPTASLVYHFLETRDP